MATRTVDDAITVLVGAIMAVLDSSIVNVALPSMSGTLGVTVEEITWVVTGHIPPRSSSCRSPACCRCASGARTSTSSACCSFHRRLRPARYAHAAAWCFRVFQGFGGGVLLTVSQAILRETFLPAAGRGHGLYGMGVVVAPPWAPRWAAG
jgi:DHA2 family multidrug resistance protein